MLAWIKSYLCDREQTVVVNDVKSTTQTVNRGVPQGSVLGPLLFTLYTTDLQHIILSHNLQCHVYADDTQIYFHATPDELAAVTPRVLACIETIKDWMSSNRLRLNPDKTEFIWFGSSHNLQRVQQTPLTVGAASIKPCSTVRDLGVYFDNTLNMKDHVTRTVQSCMLFLFEAT